MTAVWKAASRAKAEEKDDHGHNHKLLQYPAFLCVCMWGGRGRACITLFYIVSIFFLCDLRRSIPCRCSRMASTLRKRLRRELKNGIHSTSACPRSVVGYGCEVVSEKAALFEYLSKQCKREKGRRAKQPPHPRLSSTSTHPAHTGKGSKPFYPFSLHSHHGQQQQQQ